MLLKRCVQHTIIITYLMITFLAFVLTMTHTYVPVVSTVLRPVIAYSYGMMAPYQGYERLNEALMAEGLGADGTWRSISLDPYFPVLRGERKIREYYLIYGDGKNPDIVTEHATRVAKTLLQLEHERGSEFTAVRLSWDQWQPSPLGFEALHHEPSLFTRLLATYP